MSTIEPGTPVRVVIEGEYERKRGIDGPFILITTPGDSAATLEPDDPAVTVTPLDPERPTLSHDTLRVLLATHMEGNTYLCSRVWEAWQYNTMTDEDFEPAGENEEFMDDLTQAILDHIQAAHAEWTL